MMRNLLTEPCNPQRVVVLGGSGFIGRYLVEELRSRGIATVSVSSKDIDLTAPQSVEQLKSILRKDDALVFASCLTPDKGKDLRTAMRNFAMGEHVGTALQATGCAHVIYISSDSVYADEETLVRETSRCEPSSYYGIAHYFRERVIRTVADAGKFPWLIARPTLVYGLGDTHNSYGVNRFLRQIQENGTIKIFGNGEERRDHIFVADVVRFLMLSLTHRSSGIVNLATGTSPSYLEVAETCAASANRPVTIERLPRSGTDHAPALRRDQSDPGVSAVEPDETGRRREAYGGPRKAA